MTGWQPKLCATCGHAEGDHKSSGSGWPHPLRFGVCLRTGCVCLEFVPVDAERSAAA